MDAANSKYKHIADALTARVNDKAEVSSQHCAHSNARAHSATVIAMQTPLVLFAGEATHATKSQTTEGALASGRREANALNDFYGGTPVETAKVAKTAKEEKEAKERKPSKTRKKRASSKQPAEASAEAKPS